MSIPVYSIQPSTNSLSPILVSVPHAGTAIPPVLRYLYREDVLNELPDTDWLVPDLYSFCREMGINLIKANLSRYVVDLNRPADNVQLYPGRPVSDAMPLFSFDGRPIYKPNLAPDQLARLNRLRDYYEPYYQGLRTLLSDMKTKFEQIVLIEAHSIRRSIPNLSPQKFSDFIIGDRDSSSSRIEMSHAIMKALRKHDFKVSYNEPFKGGNLTRSFGAPAKGIHSIQIEMSQDIYLDEPTRTIDPEKSKRVVLALQDAMSAIIKVLGEQK